MKSYFIHSPPFYSSNRKSLFFRKKIPLAKISFRKMLYLIIKIHLYNHKAKYIAQAVVTVSMNVIFT
jgi:hypothetical protein